MYESEIIPFQVAVQDDAPEELRLKYRYLDLRRKNMRDNLILRSEIISFLNIAEPVTFVLSPILIKFIFVFILKLERF